MFFNNNLISKEQKVSQRGEKERKIMSEWSIRACQFLMSFGQCYDKHSLFTCEAKFTIDLPSFQKRSHNNFSVRFMKPIHIFLRKFGQNFDYDKKDTFICISFAGCNGICTTIWRNVDSYRAE